MAFPNPRTNHMYQILFNKDVKGTGVLKPLGSKAFVFGQFDVVNNPVRLCENSLKDGG